MSRSSTTGSACTRPWATAPRPRRGPAWQGSTCARPRDVLIPPLHSSGGGPLEAARHVISAAEEEARRNGWPCVLAVVDDGGWLVLLERMDGAPMLASVELAPGKARAAAVYRKPTRALEESINGGRAAAVTAPGFVQMQGG